MERKQLNRCLFPDIFLKNYDSIQDKGGGSQTDYYR